MSEAIAAVRSIRNATLDQTLSLRERDSSAPRDEVRGSESVSDSIESHLKPLTTRQIHAINLLSMGKTVVATAKSLDIGVSTLHRWKATHPLFRAELAQRQHNLFDEMINKLRLTMSKAVDQLFAMMTGDSKYDRKEVMFEMLKLLRPQKYLQPSEPATAAGVLDESVREARTSRGESVGTEITEEERIAAIPAEFRATTSDTNTLHQPVSTPLPSRELDAEEMDGYRSPRGSARQSPGPYVAGDDIASRPLLQPLPRGEGSLCDSQDQSHKDTASEERDQ